MEKFFSVFGKIVLVVLILGGIFYGSYYFGKKGSSVEKSTTIIDLSTEVNTLTISPSPTIAINREINGGVSKNAGLSYYQYTITVPTAWTERREKQTPDMDEKLILEKDDYQLSIMQGATGGAACLYQENPDFEGPASTFTSFSELTSEDGLNLRRSGTDVVGKTGKIGFTICMESNDGSFGQPTNYGHIYYSVPPNYDKDILIEMDKIVSSLVKR